MLSLPTVVDGDPTPSPRTSAIVHAFDDEPTRPPSAPHTSSATPGLCIEYPLAARGVTIPMVMISITTFASRYDFASIG